MPLRRYQFEYALSDRLTEASTYLTVTAWSYRIAARRAQVALKRRVNEERAARWEWHSDWLNGEATDHRAVYVSYHHLRGTLYHGYELPPKRKPRPFPPEELDRLVGGSFAETITRPIIEAIENAPVMAELFGTPLPEIPITIPLVFVTPMPRDQWPDRHP